MERFALISVHDKRGIEVVARGLKELGFQIISTGGTSRFLRERGIEVIEVSDLTGFPEILDGRVKTLHPKLHAGILARRDADHLRILKELSIRPIDLVICNLYPFEKVIEKEDVDLDEVMENIDIGGPTLIRSAAKNFENVLIVVDPSRYSELIEKLKKGVDDEFRRKLAIEAFEHVARYDAIISNYLRKRFGGEDFPKSLTLTFELVQKTRYGENPHQEGALYKILPDKKRDGITLARKLQGKELSYNNILDADSALECIREFEDPTAVIIKHTTPCGIASSRDLIDAWRKAYETDTYSPFGGVVAFNREVDLDLAKELDKHYLEVILAPKFSDSALEVLSRRKNLRLLEVPIERERSTDISLRSVSGGVLIQDKDIKGIDPGGWRVVTKRKPTDDDIRSMVFAVKCVKHVKSNAIVFVKDTYTVAIGGGQTARIDSVFIARKKGGNRLKGSIMASDGFIPFRDTIDSAAEAGIRAIVQPGGSIRDKEVIEAADEHGIIMVFTGRRYFKH